MKIKGPKRFLWAGILFGLGSIGLFMNFMNARLYALMSFPGGMLLFSIMLLWFYMRAKSGEDPLKNSMTLFVGYLFTWLGGSFLGAAFLVPESERAGVIIPAVIALLVGLGTLIGALISRLRSGKGERSEKEVRKRDSKVGTIIGGIAAGIVVVPLLVLAAIALYNGRWVPAMVLGLPPIFLITVTILVRRFGKKGRLKIKKQIAPGEGD